MRASSGAGYESGEPVDDLVLALGAPLERSAGGARFAQAGVEVVAVPHAGAGIAAGGGFGEFLPGEPARVQAGDGDGMVEPQVAPGRFGGRLGKVAGHETTLHPLHQGAQLVVLLGESSSRMNGGYCCSSSPAASSAVASSPPVVASSAVPWVRVLTWAVSAVTSLDAALEGAGVQRVDAAAAVAITAYNQAADIFRKLRDRHGEGRALNNLGTAQAEMRRSRGLPALWRRITRRRGAAS